MRNASVNYNLTGNRNFDLLFICYVIHQKLAGCAYQQMMKGQSQFTTLNTDSRPLPVTRLCNQLAGLGAGTNILG